MTVNSKNKFDYWFLQNRHEHFVRARHAVPKGVAVYFSLPQTLKEIWWNPKLPERISRLIHMYLTTTKRNLAVTGY